MLALLQHFVVCICQDLLLLLTSWLTNQQSHVNNSKERNFKAVEGADQGKRNTHSL